VRRIRRTYGDTPLSAFKALVREQFNMLLIDEEGALAAIPSMLPADTESRSNALHLIRQVLGARGELSVEDKRRLDEVERLFGIGKEPATARNLAVVEPARTQAKAS
jgi:hypothetical protein